ncbi:MAG: trigger factor [Hespellia sp.]|nr:trigger factor [Hespellia sp.]
MSLQVEKLEHNMAKLTIEVSAEEVEKALQAAYLKQRTNLSVPGFRKGKVPRQMIEKMYGPEVFYDEAANSMIPTAYSAAYDECEEEISSQPKIDIVELEKGKPFIFTAEVALKPEVTLGEYKGLKVDKTSNRVTQKEVDEEISKEAEKNARTIEVTDRAVADKDEVTLDFEGSVDGVPFEGGKGEDYPLTIGSGAFIPGFEEQLIGAEIDKELEVKVTFPEEYQAEELAGKEAVFKCTVHSIKAKELPEIDDEFASEVSEFDTLEDYRADIKKQIKERKDTENKNKKEDQAVNAAIENASMDIPEPMIDTQARQLADDFAQRIQQQGLTLEQYFQFTGLTAEKMMEELRPQAVKRIQTRLVLEAVAKAENIEVSDERIDEELAKMAEAYKMEVEKLKEFMGENEKQQMKDDIAVQEAVTLLVDNAVEA